MGQAVHIAIVIPARAGSTRFPNKPLALLAGRTVLSWVVAAAQKSTQGASSIDVLVATESQEIAIHARSLGVKAVLTPLFCKTGSDRVLAALRQEDLKPDIVVNLQGDAPLISGDLITILINALIYDKNASVATPVRRLDWPALDALRDTKRTQPFSGTTAVVSESGRALWFSKMILPAIRGEVDLRTCGAPCPILQHIGLYAFHTHALERFCALPESPYERLEGLEQLRLLESGIPICAVEIPPHLAPPMGGIDTKEDLARAEAFLLARP